MRTVRVKEVNLVAVVKGLNDAGFASEACKDVPCSSAYYYRSYPDEDHEFDSERLADDTAGMAGINTDASGHQANAVIVALKAKGIIV